MSKVQFNSETMTPWADISRVLNNLRTLKVVAGGTTYSGPAELDMVDGNCTLSIGPKAKPAAAAKPKGKSAK